MEKPAYKHEDFEPTYVTLDYMALKQCMKDAIKEALLHERQRRERAIGIYVLAMIGFGAMLIISSIGSNYNYLSIQAMPIVRVVSIVGLGATQIIFSIWALTRWF